MIEKLSNFEVVNRKSFIEFIELLHEDFLKNTSTWENKNLSSFLEALVSYAEDIQEYYDNTGQKINADQPSWQVFADIFKGATMYE
jgi:hypothetical protein